MKRLSQLKEEIADLLIEAEEDDIEISDEEEAPEMEDEESDEEEETEKDSENDAESDEESEDDEEFVPDDVIVSKDEKNEVDELMDTLSELGDSDLDVDEFVEKVNKALVKVGLSFDTEEAAAKIKEDKGIESDSEGSDTLDEPEDGLEALETPGMGMSDDEEEDENVVSEAKEEDEEDSEEEEDSEDDSEEEFEPKNDSEDYFEIILHQVDIEDETETTLDSVTEEIDGEQIGGDLVLRFTYDGDKVIPAVYAYFDTDRKSDEDEPVAIPLSDINFQVVKGGDEEDKPAQDSDVLPDEEEEEKQRKRDEEERSYSLEEPTYDDGEVKVYEHKLNEEKFIAVHLGDNGALKAKICNSRLAAKGLNVIRFFKVSDKEISAAKLELSSIREKEAKKAQKEIKESVIQEQGEDTLYVVVRHGLQKGVDKAIRKIMGKGSIESEGYVDSQRRWQFVVRNTQMMDQEEFESEIERAINANEWLMVMDRAFPVGNEEGLGGEEDLGGDELGGSPPDLDIPDDLDMPSKPAPKPVNTGKDDKVDIITRKESVEVDEATVTKVVEVRIGPGQWERIKSISPMPGGHRVLTMTPGSKPVNITRFTQDKFTFRDEAGNPIDLETAKKYTIPHLNV